LLNHLQNRGKGSAIKTGYAFAARLSIDCVATMDGDGQMNPDELESICLPIVIGEVDYVKGDRLSHSDAWIAIPSIRYWGNIILSLLTKPASGYWGVNDTQTGFTAILGKVLNTFPIKDIYEYYGYPNDILVKLKTLNCSIKEVCVQPIYHDISGSKMKIRRVIPRLSLLLLRSFFKRIKDKYFHQKLHPVFFMVYLGSVLLLASLLNAVAGYLPFHLSCLSLIIGSLLLAGGIFWDKVKNAALVIK
jgi:glycosyltransferase involved in cell wall biosynthesis